MLPDTQSTLSSTHLPLRIKEVIFNFILYLFVNYVSLLPKLNVSNKNLVVFQ